MSKLFQILFFVASTAFVGAWGYDFYLDSRFSTYPRYADPATGQIAPYKWKSATIYVSPEEVTTLRILHIVEWSSLFVGAGFFLLLRKKRAP